MCHHTSQRSALTLIVAGLTLTSAAENAYGIDWEEPLRNDDHLAIMVCLVTISAFGVLGNSLVLFSIQNDPALRSTLSGLMVCALSSTDMIFGAISCFFIPMAMGQYPSYALCEVQGFFIHSLCAASIMVLFLITVERYRLVLKNTATSRSTVKQGLALIFIVAIVFAALPLFGFGHYELQPSKMLCFARGGYGVPSDDWYCIVAIVIILNTSVGMLIMYSMIWRLINRFHKSTGAVMSDRTNQARNKAERDIVKQFIVITSLFILLWTPCVIKFVFELTGRMLVVVERAWLDTIASTMAALNSATNPIAYGIMNKHIRLAVREQLRRTFPFLANYSNQVTPSPQEREGDRGRVSQILISSAAMSLSEDAELSARMKTLLGDIETFGPSLSRIEEEESKSFRHSIMISANDTDLDTEVLTRVQESDACGKEEIFKWKLWKQVEKKILATQEAPMRVIEFDKFVAAGAIPRSDQKLT